MGWILAEEFLYQGDGGRQLTLPPPLQDEPVHLVLGEDSDVLGVGHPGGGVLQAVAGFGPGGVQGVQAAGGLVGAGGLRGSGVRSCGECPTIMRDIHPYDRCAPAHLADCIRPCPWCCPFIQTNLDPMDLSS